jgi:hypothetical protein
MSITVSNSTGTGMELWSKQGNYTGSETNSVAWTKVGGEKIMCHYFVCQSHSTFS